MTRNGPVRAEDVACVCPVLALVTGDACSLTGSLLLSDEIDEGS